MYVYTYIIIYIFFIWIKKSDLFLWWPFLHSLVSHDPSEINLIFWYGAQETFLIIVKNSRIYFQESVNKKLKRSAFRFCFHDTIKVLAVTFDQFNASLLNNSINKNKKTDSNK